MVKVTDTRARLDVPASPEPARPQPLGTPPSGGEWTWDTQAGRWVRTDQAPAPAGPADTTQE